MPTTTLSSKGQVIIPKALRETLRWRPGTQLEVQEAPDGLLLRPVQPVAKVPLAAGLAAIRRRAAYAGPVVSLAQMDGAVADEAARRAATAAPGAARKRPR